ncbi:MAG TPA: alpha/beta hydrolase [Gemmataceae bacterium]|nr:alpha/beta hydrolase [Gemmataceae bacterium]
MSTTAPVAPAKEKRRTWRRRLPRFAARAALVYAGVLALLLFFENRLVFRPTPAAAYWHQPPNDRVRDVALRAADGTALHTWWCPPEGWQPEQGAVLFFHGTGGNISHCSRAMTRWQQGPLRQAVFLVDYPGYGRSEGRPSEAGCYAAADAAYDWLTGELGVPPRRVLIYGESLGGGVAVELAARREHRALILVKTFTSMPDMAASLFPWLPGRWLVRNRFDNLTRIGACRRPVFIAHGTADDLVPFAQGQRLFAAANEPKQFLPMEGLTHQDAPAPEFDEALARFLAAAESSGRGDNGRPGE